MGVFTGCMPSTTGTHQNEPLWDSPGRRPTFVELLRTAGYYTFGAGKVFHGVFDYATAGREGVAAAPWKEVENRSFLWDAFVSNAQEPLPPIGRAWALSPPDHELVTAHAQWPYAVQGYLAAISYVDELVGRLIDTLDQTGLAATTTVILWGDNGFHLGEKLHWRKFALWEESTRVPLIVVPPSPPAVRRVYEHGPPKPRTNAPAARGLH